MGSRHHHHHLQLLHRHHTSHSGGGSSSSSASSSQHTRGNRALFGLLLLLVACCTFFVATHHTRQLTSATTSIAAARRPGGGGGGGKQAQRQAQQQEQRQLAARGGVAPPSSIPRIIHQNYLAGAGQLMVDALMPLAHFRKEWWASCQTHHPGWQYVLWDAAACEALLGDRARWFLPMWHSLGNNTVLKSDAIRPFILEAHGGVYLDLDSECFTGMTTWLEGAQLVLQAEVLERVNNAQMASVAGHPLWAAFQRAIHKQLRAGNRWALDATGPHLLTAVVRRLIGNAHGSLPGRYTLRDGSRLAVYGPQQWFTPCAWNDWGCAVDLAHNTPHMRAAGKTAATAAAARASSRMAASATAAANSSSRDAASSAMLPIMLDVQGIAGVHHFSGSWLGLDGSKSLSLRREAVAGVLRFLYNGTGFVEQACTQLKQLPQALLPAAAAPAPPATQHLTDRTAAAAAAARHLLPDVPVCWEQVTAAVAAGSCTVVSVRGSLAAAPPAHDAGRCPPGGLNGTLASHDSSTEVALRSMLGAEVALAAAGCQVSVIAPQAPDLTAIAAALGSTAESKAGAPPRRRRFLGRLMSSTAREGSSTHAVGSPLSRLHARVGVLGVVPDPFAQPPVFTLEALLAAAASLGGAPSTAGSPAGTSGTSGASSSSRVTLLMLQPEFPASVGCAAGSSSSSSLVLDVLNTLYVTSSQALTGLRSAVLLLPSLPPPGAAHKAFAAYQHFWQERGFVGFAHASVLGGGVLVGVTRAGDTAAAVSA